MAFRQRRRFIAAGSRRSTSWLPIDATITVFSGTAVLLNALTTEEKAKRPFTIIRCYLSSMIQSDQGAVSENFGVAVGIAVVSDQARAVGITALPTPATDIGSDLWMLHGFSYGRFAFNTGVGFDDHAGHIKDFSSKGMRKVNADQDVVIVQERIVIGSSEGNINLVGRVLIKEH